MPRNLTPTTPLDRKVKEQIRQRDGEQCRLCLSTERLHVHHIDGRGAMVHNPNHTEGNLITLCASCHIRSHHMGVRITAEFLERVDRIRAGEEELPQMVGGISPKHPGTGEKFLRPHNAFFLNHPEEADEAA